MSENRVAAEILVATVPDTTQADEKALVRQVTDIEVRAASMVIATDDDYKMAGEFGRALKQKASEVTAFFKPMKDSAYQAHKAVCDREKATLAPLKNAEQALKKIMGTYAMRKEQEAREQEEARRRAAQAEADRKLQEAIDLENAGDQTGASVAMMEAEVMDEASRYAGKAPVAPKASGVSTARDWEIVEIDSKNVPLAINGTEIRPVDKAAVMRLIRASKGAIQIPGIVFREVKKMSFRR